MTQAPNQSIGFEIRGLDHVVLRVKDISRSLRFYCDVLGCAVERNVEELGLIQLRAGNALIDLVDLEAPLGQQGGPAPGVNGHNVDHFCVRIEPFNLDVIEKHLSAHGVALGDIGRRYGADGYGPSIYISDPDGNTVELKGSPEENVAS